MTWINRLLRHREVERHLDKELRFHFDEMVGELCAKGATRDEALRVARLQFGGLEQVVAPVRRSRDATASARAEEAISEIAALSIRLHATLVKAGLRRL